MPQSVRMLRFATAVVTLAIVAALMLMTDRSLAAKMVAGGVLMFGAAQWLFLGLLAKRFHATSQDTGKSETD